MTVAEALISMAREQKLEHFFGIPGGGAPLDLMEAGRRLGVRFVDVSHESSAAIAAAYYGAMKHTAGLAMCVRGVGAANLAGGVANVYFERQGLVAVCECAAPSAQPEGVQQCEQQQMFAATSGYQATLSPIGGAETIRQAFAHATDGRPGPSILHCPSGVSEMEAVPGPAVEPESEPAPAVAPDLKPVADFISGLRRPVIIAGADVIRDGAVPELFRFAEAIEAAVLVTMEARGVFPESHPRWAGVFVGVFNPNVIESKILRQADGVVLAGVDAMMTHAGWNLEIPTCELAARPQYSTMTRPFVRIKGNLKALLQHLGGHAQPGFAVEEIQRARQETLKHFQRPPQARFAAQDVIEITRELLPVDGLLVSETGVFIAMLEHLWPVDRPGTYLGTAGGRTMGLMLPAILGTRLADAQRPMIGMGGDGSLLMRLGELEVFGRNGVAVPLVIVNDRALGTMKARQALRGYPDFGLDLQAVNFVAVARACGLRGVAANTPEAFRKELQRAMKSKRTTLIDAQVDPQPYWDSFGPMTGSVK